MLDKIFMIHDTRVASPVGFSHGFIHTDAVHNWLGGLNTAPPYLRAVELTTNEPIYDRDVLVSQVGRNNVLALEAADCVPTGRLMPAVTNTVEFYARVALGEGFLLCAYYYPLMSEIVAAGDDLSNVTWIISHYTIEG